MKKTNKRRQSSKSLIVLIVLTAILMISSSYAWFTSNQTVTIGTIDVNVRASNGLQISVDAETWQPIITKQVQKIIRKEITIKTVKSSVQDDIGYIQILSFISNSTPNEFLEALENTDETKGLIIDLRGNTGGLLPNAVFVSNLFLENGRKIVSIVGRNGYHYDVISEDNNIDIKKPVVLLVDNSSASASEIFSGAMKDYKRAKLVGTKTFGKGMVQKIISLPNETGINLTVAKYLTPRGFDINKNGISPDIEENITDEDIIQKRDPQYDKAKELLESMISLEK
jgi:carboxyl-terminal processing protease